MSVLVVGSLITDLVATCKKAPLAGESIIGKTFNTYLGGKGANQAICAKRMGSDTFMVGSLGNDDFAKSFLKVFKEEGFDTSLIKTSNKAKTGCSLITVEEDGQNRICVIPGANMDYDKFELEETLNKLNLDEKVSIIVTQFEMQEEIVLKLIEISKKYKKKLIINPAPAREIEKAVLNGVYLLTPNETELGILIDEELKTLDDYKRGAKKLLTYGVENVIVTLGTLGSLLVNKAETTLIPAYKVNAIDTVGAGDSFTGSLSAMLDQGYTLKEAIKIATATAALEVQKCGAIPAMPSREEVFKFLKEQDK